MNIRKPLISLLDARKIVENYLFYRCIRVNSCDQDDKSFCFNLFDDKYIRGDIKRDSDGEFISIALSDDMRSIDIGFDNIYVDHHGIRIPADQEPVGLETFDELYTSFKLYLEDGKLLSEKKHPLQNSPTFPEERSAENEICSDKNPYLTQKCYNVFDVSKFEVGACYKVLRKGKVPENEYDQFNCILTGACEDSILLTYLNLDDGAMRKLIIEVGEINDYEILKMSVTQ